MRGRAFNLFLILFIQLLVQLGGQLHVMSHHFEDQDDQHAACELCAAYTAMDHGLAPGIAALPVVVVPHETESLLGIDWRATFQPHFRSRAPPENVRVS
mgnify:CR=1 FL=1